MGCIKFNCPHRFLLCSLLALAFSLMMAQGRQLTKLNEATVRRMSEGRSRGVIGSRPPRCGERCKSCGQCEAVQVPIVPIKKLSLQQSHDYFYARSSINNNPRFPHSRGDDISNYKPMCWKCKCGDFFFNPW